MIRMALAEEVGFGCPVEGCGSPYLSWHHFDPPWSERQQHEPQGMIALCRTHHDMADVGTFAGEPVPGQGAGPVAWSRVFPTFWGIEAIENQRALEAQLAQYMRLLHNNPRDVVTLVSGQPNDFGDTGEQAYYRLRYLRERGFIEFDELREGGLDMTLMNLRLTVRGEERIVGE
jgi:hypothetical protein